MTTHRVLLAIAVATAAAGGCNCRGKQTGLPPDPYAAYSPAPATNQVDARGWAAVVLSDGVEDVGASLVVRTQTGWVEWLISARVDHLRPGYPWNTLVARPLELAAPDTITFVIRAREEMHAFTEPIDVWEIDWRAEVSLEGATWHAPPDRAKEFAVVAGVATRGFVQERALLPTADQPGIIERLVVAEPSVWPPVDAAVRLSRNAGAPVCDGAAWTLDRCAVRYASLLPWTVAEVSFQRATIARRPDFGMPLPHMRDTRWTTPPDGSGGPAPTAEGSGQAAPPPPAAGGSNDPMRVGGAPTAPEGSGAVAGPGATEGSSP